MADERSPLLQNVGEHGGQTEYLAAANEAERVDPATINDVSGVTDAEQQAVVGPKGSLIVVVRLSNFRGHV